MLERGPDEEGIETVLAGFDVITPIALERGPDEEGIETRNCFGIHGNTPLERGPDEEGIETKLGD